MSWNNAPTLNKLTASQQGGNRGAQLWGVDIKGKLYTCYQGSPGGSWSNWDGVGWNDPIEPKVFELAAAQTDPDGRVFFWALDTKYKLWARWQNTAGGGWSSWKPEFNNPPGANRPRKLAAVRGGGSQGMYLFAILADGALVYSYSTLPAGNWSAWANFPDTPDKSRFIEVTACQQKDGRGAVWVLDTERRLWGAGQESKGGKWGPWNGPNWLSAPRLRNIAAVEGKNGAIITGQNEDYQVIANFQSSPGSNTWGGWSKPVEADPRSYELTAAGQNNGTAQLWAITNRGTLTSVTQKDATHWDTAWSDKDTDSDLPTPPPKPKPRRPTWNNAPPLNKLTAAQHAGPNLGAQIWGVDVKGQLYTALQKPPGGRWSEWIGTEWNPMNHPPQVYELAACTLGDGRVKLWVLDMKHEIWTTEQTEASSDWMGWWHSTKTKWNNAQWTFRKIAATQMKDDAIFIGVKEDGHLAVCFGGAGKWGRWRDNFHPTPENSRWIEFTACKQGDGRIAFWGLDEQRRLWGAGEKEAGTGNMGDWNGPNWLSAPRLRNIAAVEGKNGAIITGQDEDYQVIANFQSSPGSTKWSGWSRLANGPRSYELTAAGQNNGLAQIWAITLGGKLSSIAQTDATHWPDAWSHYDKATELPKPPEPKKK